MQKIQPDYPNIGGNIKKMRELRNYTQEYMAQCLGISKSRYSQIEQEKNINTGHLYEIAKILNTNIYAIIEFNEQEIFNTYYSKDFRPIFMKEEDYSYQTDPNIKDLIMILKKVLEQSKDRNEKM